MPVPDFQSLMLPFLRLLSDNQEHRLSETIDTLGDQVKLTEEERRELLPSGRQFKFDNRVGWVRTHLKKAGLIERTGHGRFRITDRGRDALRQNPSRIDMRFLMQFPEFKEFRNLSRLAAKLEPDQVGEEEHQGTPEETLEASYQTLRRNLAQEILERVKQCSPRFFERLVVDLLVAMGYGGSRKDAGKRF